MITHREWQRRKPLHELVRWLRGWVRIAAVLRDVP